MLKLLTSVSYLHEVALGLNRQMTTVSIIKVCHQGGCFSVYPSIRRACKCLSQLAEKSPQYVGLTSVA